MKTLRQVMVIVLLGLSVGFISAQDEDLKPLYTGQQIQNLAWSSDSQVLTFQEIVSGMSILEAPWSQYEAATDRLTSDLSRWPVQTRIPSAVNHMIDRQFSVLLQTNLFPSPDGRYAVTAQSLPSGELTTVIIDITDNRVVDTGIEPLGIGLAPHFFHVTWSDDSEAFVVATSALMVSEPSFFHYVTGFTQADKEIEVQVLTRLDVAEVAYTTLDIYDVSSIGTRVLLRIGYGRFNETGTQTIIYPLFIWDRQGLHQLLEEDFHTEFSSVRAASFAPDDENDLLVVDKRGLVRYSLTTGETVVLRPDINAERFFRARFSPDGRSLALYQEGQGQIPTVYLFDVTGTLPPAD